MWGRCVAAEGHSSQAIRVLTAVRAGIQRHQRVDTLSMTIETVYYLPKILGTGVPEPAVVGRLKFDIRGLALARRTLCGAVCCC